MEIILIGLSFTIGALPVIGWITYAWRGETLANLGTGNVSVSAAFYHGGKFVGILAVLSETLKGVGVVILARFCFPDVHVWEIIALISLVAGRYFIGKGAGTTNTFWGMMTFDVWITLLTLLIGGLSFLIWRNRYFTRVIFLLVLFLLIAFNYWSQPAVVIATLVLCLFLGWVLMRIPDDLNLSTQGVDRESRKLFTFFRGQHHPISLAGLLDATKVGQKAANLSQLKAWGYLVPQGWVLLPGDSVGNLLTVSQDNPYVVRSSALDEDGDLSSAAGQYTSILYITSQEDLQRAIATCRDSYNNQNARQYRQDRGKTAQGMAVIVQKQVKGVLSGVAFSRDPLQQGDGAVLVEAFSGDATVVVSGQVTPQSYRVMVGDKPISPGWELPESEVITAIAHIARDLENRYLGIPQDIEWSYDGRLLWLLQVRPITTLQPLWTRKIAAEVIPGVIKPLTWSINRPLTCGVWGEIFTLVLGKRSQGLNFEDTATLHWGRAYFNASLLGDIFRRMGLPPESLEFLTRGAKMTKPPILSTFSNLPGLLRLLAREWSLEKDWQRDYQDYFQPVLIDLQLSPTGLSPQQLILRIDKILQVLKRATYYSILAPLSFALRQGILKVNEMDLDNSLTPEVASLRSLAALTTEVGNLPQCNNSQDLFTYLEQSPEGKIILDKFAALLSRYGYLSETATDISIPRWRDNPSLVQDLFYQLWLSPQPDVKSNPLSFQGNIVQQRLNLKGRVTEVYSQFLAHLRWSFLALGEEWVRISLIDSPDSIFWLEYTEIKDIVLNNKDFLRESISQRQTQWQEIKQITTLPYLVYGNSPGDLIISENYVISEQQIQGIGASPGEVTGIVVIAQNLGEIGEINREMIIVVPYTDSGWGPFLARAGGIIAEVGGRLSHGAIIAREYGIPAVMDVHNATKIFKDGQRVKIDGKRGIVEIII